MKLSEEAEWTARSLRAADGVPFRGWRVVGERLLRDEQGNLIWILNPPKLREWIEFGVLADQRPTEWRLEDHESGALLRCDQPEAELDLIELRGAAARAFERDDSEPMTIVPTFRSLGGPDDLGQHLVGGRVLSGGPRTKWPVEQAAIYLYRIARLRGGAFWDGVAGYVAAATVRRIEEAPAARLVSNHWGKGETHVRFLADAALLLAAHAELTRADRYRLAAERAADGIESFGAPVSAGRWYLHDSVEQAHDRNDLVLNTHLHALTALHACGRDVRLGLHALEAVLGARARGLRAAGLGAALAASDLGRAYGPGRAAGAVARRVHSRVARLTGTTRALRLPGGFVARDSSGANAPFHYMAVNLSDLAVLQRNTPTPAAAAALAAAVRYTLSVAYTRAELRSHVGTAAFIPGALYNAGHEGAANRAVSAVRRAGCAPLVGWPGYRDSLWSRLAEGTP